MPHDHEHDDHEHADPKDCSKCRALQEQAPAEAADGHLTNERAIEGFIHCGLCGADRPRGPHGIAPRHYARLEVGFTERGLQIWCVRHDCNVMHIDFQGACHPANTRAVLQERDRALMEARRAHERPGEAPGDGCTVTGCTRPALRWCLDGEAARWCYAHAKAIASSDGPLVLAELYEPPRYDGHWTGPVAHEEIQEHAAFLDAIAQEQIPALNRAARGASPHLEHLRHVGERMLAELCAAGGSTAMRAESMLGGLGASLLERILNARWRKMQRRPKRP